MGYRYQKQYLESEEQYSGLGFSVLEKEFYQLEKGDEIIDPNDYESFGGIQIYMSMDTKQHSRSIYSLLDFLGDIGGLHTNLLTSGCILTQIFTLVFGSFQQSFLIPRIFEVCDLSTSNQKQGKSSSRDKRLDQNERNSKQFGLCRRDRNSKLFGKGLSRIEKQFDVETFLKRQFRIDIALKTIFTRTERKLLKKNRYFIIENHSADHKNDNE